MIDERNYIAALCTSNHDHMNFNQSLIEMLFAANVDQRINYLGIFCNFYLLNNDFAMQFFLQWFKSVFSKFTHDEDYTISNYDYRAFIDIGDTFVHRSRSILLPIFSEYENNITIYDVLKKIHNYFEKKMKDGMYDGFNMWNLPLQALAKFLDNAPLSDIKENEKYLEKYKIDVAEIALFSVKNSWPFDFFGSYKNPFCYLSLLREAGISKDLYENIKMEAVKRYFGTYVDTKKYPLMSYTFSKIVFVYDLQIPPMTQGFFINYDDKDSVISFLEKLHENKENEKIKNQLRGWVLLHENFWEVASFVTVLKQHENLKKYGKFAEAIFTVKTYETIFFLRSIFMHFRKLFFEIRNILTDHFALDRGIKDLQKKTKDFFHSQHDKKIKTFFVALWISVLIQLWKKI
jgi:hypothetical protein